MTDAAGGGAGGAAAAAAGRRVRVLVADDSPTSRELTRALLERVPGVEVVGVAAHGLEAVERAVALRPDLITMDVAMPVLDGLEATRRIMAEAPARIVVVCGVDREQAVDLSLRAVEAGALEVVAKTRPGEDPAAFGRRLVESVRLMAEVPVVRRAPRSAAAPALAARAPIDVVALVASTGGPPVLAELLGALPRRFPAPVLVVQHIAPGFEDGLVRWLGQTTPLAVGLARDGEACTPGRVHVAPGGLDLVADGEGVLRLTPARGPAAPSGDRLLESVAAAWGARAAGVVLTGMGTDGARGLLALRTRGGLTLAQDAATSVVWGMPGAAVELGAAAHVLPPALIARALREAVGGASP